ncbi:Ig-like domain-containing protein [Streptomyces capparidis]
MEAARGRDVAHRGAERALAVLAALAAVAALLGLAACRGAPGPQSQDGRARSAPAVRITPHDGARGVEPAAGLRVEARRGQLTRVRVTDDEGRAVAGRLSRDHRLWLPDGRLAPGTAYRVSAVAVDAGGERTAVRSTFTTEPPEGTFIGYYTPENGSTVGVGMPVSLRFTRPVADRRAVERAVRVTAEPHVEIAPHWFGDTRLDFRPRDYWLPGTRVTLRMRLDGVEGAPGVYGTQDRTVRFTVGRSQVSTVDVAAHTMTVRRGGRVVRVLPVTAGSAENPTYNGRMVITEKAEVTRMNSRTVGFGGEYDIPDVPHAMRLTDSGTFIHGNYWAEEDVFGRANTSHGCIGLADVKPSRKQAKGVSPAPRATEGGESTAAWFFRHSLLGDVVEVVGSPDRTVSPDNGLNGWNMDWSTWVRGSALVA